MNYQQRVRAWLAYLVQVLCASNEAHDEVEPVLVPEGVLVGERITFKGWDGVSEPVLNPKKKLWEKIAPDLKTNAGALSRRPAGTSAETCLHEMHAHNPEALVHMLTKCLPSNFPRTSEMHAPSCTHHAWQVFECQCEMRCGLDIITINLL